MHARLHANDLEHRRRVVGCCHAGGRGRLEDSRDRTRPRETDPDSRHAPHRCSSWGNPQGKSTSAPTGREAPRVNLVDTSVWIDFFRGRTSVGPLAELIREGSVLVHPWVMGEIALGALGTKRQSVLADLALFPRSPV